MVGYRGVLAGLALAASSAAAQGPPLSLREFQCRIGSGNLSPKALADSFHTAVARAGRLRLIGQPAPNQYEFSVRASSGAGYNVTTRGDTVIVRFGRLEVVPPWQRDTAQADTLRAVYLTRIDLEGAGVPSLVVQTGDFSPSIDSLVYRAATTGSQFAPEPVNLPSGFADRYELWIAEGNQIDRKKNVRTKVSPVLVEEVKACYGLVLKELTDYLLMRIKNAPKPLIISGSHD